MVSSVFCFFNPFWAISALQTMHHARKANNTIDLRQNIHKNGIQNEGPNLDD
jgi:hypothetical protein